MADVGQVGEAFISLRYRMDHLDSDLRTATGKIGQQLQGVEAGVGNLDRSVGQAAKGIGGKLGRAFAGLQEPVAQLGGAIAGLGAANLFSGMIKTAADFQGEMNRVAGVLELMPDQIGALNEQAKKLGAETSFSATEAAKGMGELAQAGFSVEQIMKAIPGALNLAAAAQTDVGTAADIAGSAMNQFGLSADQITRVNDTLTAAANKTAANLVELGYSMKYAGPLANSLGIDIETAASAIGILSQAGIKGEQGGTALRAVFDRLLAPSKEVRKVFEELGVTTEDLNFKNGGLQGVLERLAPKLTDVKDRAIVFGVEAQVAGGRLLDQAGALRVLVEQVRAADGATDRLGAINMEGAIGAILAYEGAWETLNLRIADSGILAAFTSIVNAIGDVIAKLSEASPTLLRFGAGFVGMTALIAPVAAAVGAFALVAGTVGAPVLAAAGALVVLGAGAVAFGDKIATAFTATKGYLAGLVADWDGTFAGLGSVFARLDADILAGVSRIGASLAAWGNTVKSGIVGALSLISPELAAAADFAITTYANTWTAGVETILTAIRGAFAIVITAAREALLPFTTMGDEITAAFGRSFAEGVGLLTGSVIAAIITFGSSIRAQIIEAAMGLLAGWTAELNAGDFAGGVRVIIGKIGNALAALPQVYGQYVLAFATGFAKAIGSAFGVDIIAGVEQGIAALKAAVAGGLTGMKDLAIRVIKAMVDGIKAQITGRLNKVLEGIKEPIENVKKFFNDLYQDVVGGSSFTDLVSGVGEKTGQLQGLMVHPMAGMTGEVSGMFTAMGDKAVAEASRVGQAMNAAAKPANNNRAGGGARQRGVGGRFVSDDAAAAAEQDAAARRERIDDINREIAQLQRLNEAQNVSAEEYTRVKEQIDGENFARTLGLDAKSAEGQAIANLAIQQDRLTASLERAEQIRDAEQEAFDAQRLAEAQLQGVAARDAMARAIYAEQAARELGAEAGEAEIDRYVRAKVAAEDFAASEARTARIQTLQQEVGELERLSEAEAQGVDAYHATALAIEQERAVRELGIGATKEEIATTRELIATKYELANAPDPTVMNAGAGANRALEEYVLRSQEHGRIAGEAIAGGLGIAEDGLKQFLMTGKFTFADLEKSLERFKEMLIEIAAQQIIAGLVGGMMGGGMMGAGGGMAMGGRRYAKGGVISGPGISAYSGSIVSSPTIFPFARGMGLMGEAGPEAILPLKRGASGRLGVEVAANDTAANDSAPRVTVQVFDQRQGGAPVQQSTSRGADGSETIRLMIRDEVKRAVAGGDVDKAMAQRYGTKPQLQR